MIIEVSLLGAFAGGILTLLSPCSALLLPSFFAYAFQSARQLVSRTFIFFLGLCTLFIPLGLGAGAAGRLVIEYREQLIIGSGILLIAFGLVMLAGRAFSLVPAFIANYQPKDQGWFSVYTLGVIFGFAGTCSGPVLGAVLTMAAAAANPVTSVGLLVTYALGMAAPLFILALVWDRFNLGKSTVLRGRELDLGLWRVHSTQALAGLLFVLIGVLFVATEGTLGLEVYYERLGLVDLALDLQRSLSPLLDMIPQTWVYVGIAAGAALALWKLVRQLRP